MVNLIGRSVGWVLRQGGRFIVFTLLRRGGRSAVDTALTAVPKTTQRSHIQIFNVTPAVTVYVRASHCRITVSRQTDPKVILEANLYRAFGVELTAEQDEAGVYIVAKRKAVVGRVTRTEFTLTVPADSHLAFHLTPGDVIFQDIEGMIELPTRQVFPAKPSA
jgi:hypothetical protein